MAEADCQEFVKWLLVNANSLSPYQEFKCGAKVEQDGFCEYHLAMHSRIAWLMLAKPCLCQGKDDDHCSKCYAESLHKVSLVSL